jgi:hypothetical protein
VKRKSSYHVLTHNPILFDGNRGRIRADELVERLRREPDRILADDEVGLVLYTGDLEVYTQSGIGDPVSGSPPLVSGGFHVRRVLQISVPRPEVPLIRRQVGSAVISVAPDSVFFVLSGSTLRRVRGEDLAPCMILASGEKVYW